MPSPDRVASTPDGVPRRYAGMRHLRQIMAGVSDGMILVGPDQTIAWANAPALKMHGVTSREGLGGDVVEYRRRLELRYRNRHRLAEGA